MTGVVLTVGNVLMGDDGAGPLLAELLEQTPAPGWIAIDGGTVPENVLHAVRAEAPERVLLVDAADMGLPPGTVREILPEQVARQFLLTTHAIPLDMLIASLHESVAEITFIGIQPAQVSFFAPMTPEVRTAVEHVHGVLVSGLAPALAWSARGADESTSAMSTGCPNGVQPVGTTPI